MDYETMLGAAGAYKLHAAAAAGGYLSALIVPVPDLFVWAFRLVVKFPLVSMAIKKNPEAVKAAFDAIEKALDAEVDAVAGKPATPQPAPAEATKP